MSAKNCPSQNPALRNHMGASDLPGDSAEGLVVVVVVARRIGSCALRSGAPAA